MAEISEKADNIGWHRKIGNRIILTAIIAAVLPMILLGGTIAVKVRLDLVKQTIAAQKTLSASLLHGIDALFQNYRRQLEAVAGLPAVQSMRCEQQLPVVEEFLDQQRVFFGCRVFDADGNTIVVAVKNRKDEAREPSPQKIDLAAADGFAQTLRHVLKSGRAAMFANETATYSERALFLLVPIRDFVNYAAIIGVISVSISISSPDIHEMISGFPIEAEDILLLLDRNGGIISSQGRLPEGLTGITVDKVSRQNLENIEIKIAGVDYLGTIAPVPGSDGLLLVARPRALVLAFLHHLLLDLALMVVIAFVMAVTAGFFLSRSLAEGISNLIAAIKNVSSGIVSHRVEVRGEDELAEASQAFNDMVSTLEKHRMMDDIWSREWQAAQKDNDDHGDSGS